MKPISIWSTHEVELQYQLSPIDPHCWIFVLEPMGSREISLQICYYFGLACGRVLPPLTKCSGKLSSTQNFFWIYPSHAIPHYYNNTHKYNGSLYAYTSYTQYKAEVL